VTSTPPPVLDAPPPLPDAAPTERHAAADPAPAAAPGDLRPVARTEQLLVLGAILLPVAGIAAAAMMLWGYGLHATDLFLLATFYALSGFGVTIGYHRLFTHRGFQAPAPIRFALAAMGSMAVQGSVIQWVGTHRRHHQKSDQAGDPHSPHGHGTGAWAALKGFWHAHTGWLFAPEQAEVRRYAADLEQDRVLRFVDRTFVLWVTLGLLAPALIGGLVTASWTGAFTGLLWGGLVRIFLLHHVTWSVNSACHLWGRQTYECHDRSRNNVIVGILGMGEGWHNNHHAFPRSARHGLAWWQFDSSWMLIRLLKLMRLARNVQLPKPELMARKRRRKGRLGDKGRLRNK